MSEVRQNLDRYLGGTNAILADVIASAETEKSGYVQIQVTVGEGKTVKYALDEYGYPMIWIPTGIELHLHYRDDSEYSADAYHMKISKEEEMAIERDLGFYVSLYPLNENGEPLEGKPLKAGYDLIEDACMQLETEETKYCIPSALHMCAIQKYFKEMGRMFKGKYFTSDTYGSWDFSLCGPLHFTTYESGGIRNHYTRITVLDALALVIVVPK